MNENIGTLLLQARKSKKLTRKELAEISNFKERTIASYEREENKPSEEYIDFIEHYFNVDIREKLNKGRKSIAYYDTFDTSVGHALVKNNCKYVYNDNPLISLIFDGSNFPDSLYLEVFQGKDKNNLDNITLINGLDFQKYTRFFMRELHNIIGYFDNYLKKLSKVNSLIIVKNNLFEVGYPLLESDFLGAVWWVNISHDKVILKPLSRNFDFNFNYLVDETKEFEENKHKYIEEFNKLKNFKIKMTREEFNKLTILGTDF